MLRITITTLLATIALLLGGCDGRNDSNATPSSSSSPTSASNSTPYRSGTTAATSGTTTPRDVDNTAVNERDRDAGSITADQAGQSQSDVDLAAAIRKKVTDTQMSVNAQNVKIIVLNGKVTLRGPVKSQAEKDSIGKFAAEVAGAANVDNQLEVETNP